MLTNITSMTAARNVERTGPSSGADMRSREWPISDIQRGSWSGGPAIMRESLHIMLGGASDPEVSALIAMMNASDNSVGYRQASDAYAANAADDPD